MENKLEGVNKLKEKNFYLIEKIKKMEDSKKDNEIIILKCENKNIKQLIKSKEKEFEIKEKEFEIKEKDFIEKINNLNKRLINYEETTKYQSSRITLESCIDRDKSVIRIFNI
jgi:hypothetical protein